MHLHLPVQAELSRICQEKGMGPFHGGKTFLQTFIFHRFSSQLFCTMEGVAWEAYDMVGEHGRKRALLFMKLMEFWSQLLRFRLLCWSGGTILIAGSFRKGKRRRVRRGSLMLAVLIILCHKLSIMKINNNVCCREKGRECKLYFNPSVRWFDRRGSIKQSKSISIKRSSHRLLSCPFCSFFLFYTKDDKKIVMRFCPNFI